MKKIRKILIMGLPGSGKSFLAKELNKRLKANWLNADEVRKKFNDWDFSKKGTLRQAKRMRSLAKKSKKKFVIADFVCPYKEGRKIFKPDYLIWMDTIKRGRLPTFDKTFQKPKKFDFKINNKNVKLYSKLISNKIKNCSATNIRK
jgi:adenylylsulfate kinase|tara:strand:- start:540 stop:977 length:438 start_codon:yes stop_codon:yes gene_type:complete